MKFSSISAVLALALQGLPGSVARLNYPATIAELADRRLAGEEGGGGGSATEETCHDVWAYEAEKDVCAEQIGANYWGWTNGRFGTSDCTACECPECPTTPPQPEDPPTKAPTPDPLPLPQKCIGITGSWSGDPHMKTFDGLKYDCQGEGEFHVLKTLESNLQIQGRFVRFHADKRPTVTKSLVWDTDEGDPLIQVTVPDTPFEGKCMPFVHVEKELVAHPLSSQFIAGTVQIAYRKEGKLEGFIFYHHSSGMQVTVLGKKSSANGCVIAAKFCLPDSWPRSKETFMGLLGNADGDKSNDWMDRNNNPVEVPTNKKDLKFDKSYYWCKDWCVNSENDSLFAYDGDKGESYGYFDHCDLPADTETQVCVENPGDDLANICGLDDLSCLVDGCVGGVEEAKDFLVVEAAMKDADCGKEIEKFEFSEKDAEDWGDILKLDGGNPFLALHQQSKTAMRTLKVPASADLIEIEFKFLEIGGWEDHRQKKYEDFVFLNIGKGNDQTQVDLLGFSTMDTVGNPAEKFDGVKRGITWTRLAITDRFQDFGLQASDGTDQMHKITVRIPPKYYETNGELTFGFEVDISGVMKNELAGVDDFRVIAYGQGCEIAQDQELPEDEGRDYNSGCGEQVLFEDFEGYDKHEWGTIEKQAQHSYLRLDNESKKLKIKHEQFPEGAEFLSIEFDMYALGDWSICGEPEATRRLKKSSSSSDDTEMSCTENELKIKVEKKEIVKLDLFEKGGEAESSGEKHKVEWTRNIVSKNIVHVELKVPKKLFDKDELDLEFEVKAGDKGTNEIGVGIDDLRITTFAQGCPHGQARRALMEFMENMKPQHSISNDFITRHLAADVETEDCTCVCPTLPGDQPGAPGTPTGPVVMDMYYRANKNTCEPEGEQLGSVIMTQNSDGTVTFDYEVDDKYELKETSVYVGKERLPFDDLTGAYLPEDEFPYTWIASGTSAKLTAEPLVCDYYAAVYARVCGDFPITLSPTKSPTGAPDETDAPTRIPTTSPTALPTKSPTDEPTDSPTPSPTNAPTTLAPTVESGHPSASPTTGTPTVSPTDEPTDSPTTSPTDKPTDEPTAPPTGTPTVSDTIDPTFEPTKSPTDASTDAPTPSPTNAPTTLSPTVESGHPSASPITGTPTVSPTDEPTASPTASPTDKLTDEPTDAPTGSPKTPPPVTKPPKTEPPTNTPPGSFGDPHVKVWSGETFDFHGSCDLVLLDNPSFHNGVGMSIHIRTKIVTWWSFIETAVVRVGNETIEVSGGQQHKYFVNGVEGDSTAKHLLFSELGLKVLVKQATGHQLKIRIDLLNADAIGLETFKEFVRVNIRMQDPKWKKFEGSTGLMGAYPTGATFGRDSKTVFTDMNAFGQEWQVRESEPMLFHNVDGPQHPTKCVMPEEATTEQKRRRLGESMITREDADLACARVGGPDHDACVFDVLATNDKDMAGSY